MDHTTGDAPLLDVQDLTVDVLSRAGVAQRVVHGVSFTLHKEETLALIGESGSGKSISAMAVMGLLPATTARVGGSARHLGTDLLTLPADQLRARRGKKIRAAGRARRSARGDGRSRQQRRPTICGRSPATSLRTDEI
ncbi:ATP-binding cassette domain-containing protein [Streptomyces sp. NPDC002814]